MQHRRRKAGALRLLALAACLYAGCALLPEGETMTERAEANFRVTGWDEAPYFEAEGSPKLARAQVTKAYTGDLEGTGTVEQLAVYRGATSATFTALERFEGKLLERAGSFVLLHRGVFEADGVDSTWSVVRGTATGALAGLEGQIAFRAGHQESWDVVFEYAFDDPSR